MSDQSPPRWDLSNVFPALESAEFQAAVETLNQELEGLENFFAQNIRQPQGILEDDQMARIVGEFIRQVNRLLVDAGTIRAYIHSFVSTDSYNTLAKRILSEFDRASVRIEMMEIQFRDWIGKQADKLPAIISQDETAAAHAFFLQEAVEQSQYQLSQAEEDLAAELSLSGTRAWAKLQGTITSQLGVDFELDGKVRRLPMPALINLHSHPDPSVRKRAYEAEMKAWESVQEPLAACMNGIKGAVNTLNRRRKRTDALHSAIDDARISRSILETMLNAMRESLPMFRKYYKAKAARFGKEKLAWWDIFAPTGKSDTTFTFPQAQAFIVENFAKFSPDLAEFAQKAFDHRWIDAEQRDGKRGGAFCMRVPGVKESRILCNFDGSLDQVFTIAHELGHGYHNSCAFQANKTPIQMNNPMTLAETASIMCETVIMDAALSKADDPQERLAILETSLISDSQVIVDIYSRYLFEKEVFERRAKAELSAGELCEIMERAQIAAYGDGLDETCLHKYMWTWKPHYYSAELSFYNSPYAFGLLFGIGLYAIYRQKGPDFIPVYKQLLAGTGEAKAQDLASRLGIDLTQTEFWQNSLSVIGNRIDLYTSL